ncbi:malto-oligosyltrehalose synthase [Mycolicibacterium duvalii]|uniref:Putative maltooligosyl trehalose synthase n=1 Tax=Mycolicibacterium duvalii TaxID=39688 RepID=A0A7I7JY43_9MYCO|nr:malto-oligosyltrehalose synthase [Mycolicibacterium duvalii]MCV7366834.1 malto-oligosyltrehalose synthase [Mycolicibacterium duvalii]PEG43959.1 malto-oligosyltrehalose synthase [Mycolicibacterium duvalii]BBX16703.1 putative maltooligosyl trehalose synthase [Mycolicibacterium duvalii]
MAVLSTYRLQMRGAASGDAFTFADAEELVDYFAELGVSHLYLSPILTAAHGSTHGYDVTDPTTVSAELGGPEGLHRLAAAARAAGLGLVVDIVPNHVGVDVPRQNAWWWDLLTHGRRSEYASFFDIDWDLDPDGRIILPVLGSDDDVDDLVVDGDQLRLGDLAYPIAPGTADAGASGAQVHDRQHYRLVGWRSGVCGYRRFFSITSLAGLRQEDRAVFDTTHTEVGRWFSAELVDGIRIDHPDGLSDPAGYLVWLRQLIGPHAWLVIEKILAVDEALDLSLPVQGTTGYDALREAGGVFVDPSGEEALTELVESPGGDYAAMPDVARRLKVQAVTATLASELARLCRTAVATTGRDHPLLPDAVAAVLSHVGVYRSDYPALSAVLPGALAATAVDHPHLDEPLTLLAAALAGSPEVEVRLQQLCGAATAKSMEDCLFYRDARLVSLNEVGGEPDKFGVSTAEFHRRAAVRAALWPQAMTTLSTHDTKRGEDVRARIGVLSQVPSLWAEMVRGWERVNPSPDAQTALFLWQNIFGVWPTDGAVTDELRHRLHAYTEKAIREAALHTAWNDPDDGFESAVHAWLDTVFDGPIATEMTELVARIDQHARSDALGQKLIALTAPGVPDVYQGTELWEDSLVDPDNRRPVDYAARREALRQLAHPKIRVVRTALQLRRERPETFLAGGHRPVLADGENAGHVVAFLRGDDVLVAVSRWTVRLADNGWGDTTVTLPTGAWTDRLSGAAYSGTVRAEDLFANLPVALLVHGDD